jgi:hypothetical protein
MPQGDGRGHATTFVRRSERALALSGACICAASPWCQGPTSRDWATCRDDCRGCHPPKPKRGKDPLDAGVVADE